MSAGETVTLTPWEERVHQALVAAADEAPPSATSPSPDRIWDAVRGQLPSREAQDVIDAALRDPAAYAELRMALALAAELDAIGLEALAPAVSAKSSRSVRTRRWGVLAFAIAAALLAALTLRSQGEPPVASHGADYRDSTTPSLGSDLEPGHPLPRDAFELRWDAVPGAHYTISVSTESARLVTHRRGLREPSLTVPAAKLTDLPRGTRLLWRVEAVLEDGTREHSPTFVVTLQ